MFQRSADKEANPVSFVYLPETLKLKSDEVLVPFYTDPARYQEQSGVVGNTQGTLL